MDHRAVIKSYDVIFTTFGKLLQDTTLNQTQKHTGQYIHTNKHMYHRSDIKYPQRMNPCEQVKVIKMITYTPKSFRRKYTGTRRTAQSILYKLVTLEKYNTNSELVTRSFLSGTLGR